VVVVTVLPGSHGIVVVLVINSVVVNPPAVGMTVTVCVAVDVAVVRGMGG
jgi:hypothetical protein